MAGCATDHEHPCQKKKWTDMSQIFLCSKPRCVRYFTENATVNTSNTVIL